MPRYDELKTVRKLSDRGDTNSVVHLVKEANADNLYVRKVIFGIEQPLYQGIFLREVQALYKLNNCDNIVKIMLIARYNLAGYLSETSTQNNASPRKQKSNN